MADRGTLRFISRAITGGIPSINVTRGSAQNVAAVGNLFAAAAQEVGRNVDANVQREAQEAGALAGFRGTPDLQKGNSIQAQAFNDSARTSMMLRVDFETKGKIDELAETHRTDPNSFLADVSAFTKEVSEGIQSVSPELAEVYRMKSEVAVRSEHIKISREAEKVQANTKEGILLQGIDTLQKKTPAYLQDILSGDPELVSLGAMALLGDAGGIFTMMKSQKFSDGTPMRTDAEIIQAQASFRDTLAFQVVQTMGDQAETPEDIKEIIAELKANTLQLPIVDFTPDGPTMRVAIPVDILDVEQRDKLENFLLAELSDRKALSEQSDLRGQAQADRNSRAAAEAMKDRGQLVFVNTELMTPSQLVDHELRQDAAAIQWGAGLEMDGKYPNQRLEIIEELRGNAFSFQDFQRLEALGAAHDKLQQAMDLDPKAEIIRMNPELENVQDIEVKNELIAEEQRRHGRAENQIRYADNQEIARVDQLVNGAKSGQDLIDSVVALQGLHGSKSQEVLNEASQAGFVNSRVGVLANLMLRNEDGTLNSNAVIYADILKARKSDGSALTLADLRESIKDESIARDIDDLIGEDLTPFVNSFSANQIGSIELYQNAVTTLAYFFGTTSGKDEAVERAIKALVPYEFVDLEDNRTVRIPKNVFSKTIKRKIEDKTGLVDMVLARGGVFNPAEALSLDEFINEQAIEAHISSTRRVGIPTISEREDGISLLDAHSVPVRDEFGNVIVVTWEEIEASALSTEVREKRLTEAFSLPGT